MPLFKIIETVREERHVEADCAQSALDSWLIYGEEAVAEGPFIEVEDRTVTDMDDNELEVEESNG